MLEAATWTIGFLLVLLLTWFVGKYYAEKMAARKIAQHRLAKGREEYSAGLKDVYSSAAHTQAGKKLTHQGKTTGLRLAAKNGKLIDPEDSVPTSPQSLNKASK